MTISHLDLGNLYMEKGGSLERRMLGCILHMSQQILHGGLPNPTQAQTNWATMIAGSNLDVHIGCARQAMEYAIVSNSTVQNDPLAVSDSDLNFVVGQFAGTYTG